MPEVLNYVPAKEGLAALDSFVAGKSGYQDLVPFVLPVRIPLADDPNFQKFSYYQGVVTGVKKYFRFYLPRERVATLGDHIYVRPNSEIARGNNSYYWLSLHVSSEVDLPTLTSCRLKPEDEKHKIDFLNWHGLEEQLFADYILGVNGLKFTDLLPFNLTGIDSGQLIDYWIAGTKSLSLHLRKSLNIQKNDTLRFIFLTDDQKLYEWVDILKADKTLPEEKWPLVSSYRLLPEEHRIYANGWVGSDKQLLIDRMRGRPQIEFKNLRPIRSSTIGNGTLVNVIDVYTYSKGQRTQRLRGAFSLVDPLPVRTETISMPVTDEQHIYEWLDLYRYDPLTNRPIGEMLASARITSECLDQKGWSGVEKQLFKDYIAGIVSFEQLRPIKIKVSKSDNLYLCVDDGKVIYFILSSHFALKPGDSLTLVPEREIEEGTDFLLTKDGATLARYRLDLKTKKFTCIDNLVAKEQTASTDGWVEILKEYEQRLLAGEKLSYEEFMKGRQI